MAENSNTGPLRELYALSQDDRAGRTCEHVFAVYSPLSGFHLNECGAPATHVIRGHGPNGGRLFVCERHITENRSG